MRFFRNSIFVSATVFKHILGARNQLWAWLPEVDSRVLINWLRVFTKVYLSLQTSILKSGKCKNTRSSSVCPWPTTQRADRRTVCSIGPLAYEQVLYGPKVKPDARLPWGPTKQLFYTIKLNGNHPQRIKESTLSMASWSWFPCK